MLQPFHLKVPPKKFRRKIHPRSGDILLGQLLESYIFDVCVNQASLAVCTRDRNGANNNYV